jgi:phosphoglycerate dehydrogenase-like enzyme
MTQAGPPPTVLVPWPVGDAPPGLTATVYDGIMDPPADVLGVELYVVPYQSNDTSLGLIGTLPALKSVQLLTAGYEHIIDLLPPGVELHNGAGLHDASTAEHAVALILAAQRELPRWALNQERHVWDRRFTRSLADSRVLIVGYGNIGRAIEARLLPFETSVTKVAGRARRPENVHAADDLPQLLPNHDIVVLVVPDSPQTRGLIGAAELALLPDDALVVNVGRGSALDQTALIAENGRIRAALDVVRVEPLPTDDPLWSAPGVYITPHIAGGSAAFWPRAHRLVNAQLERWAAGEPLINRVATGA